MITDHVAYDRPAAEAALTMPSHPAIATSTTLSSSERSDRESGALITGVVDLLERVEEQKQLIEVLV